MAFVEKRGSKRYRARYRGLDRKERSRTFAKRSDAERWLAERVAERDRGVEFDPNAARVPFRDYAEDWRRRQIHRPTTVAQVETHLRRHVYPFFEGVQLAHVRPSAIQAWVRHLNDALAPSTVHVVYRWVAAVSSSAVDDGILLRTPCRGVSLPRVERTRVIPITTDQVWAVVAAIEPRYRALVVLAASTGLRQGEVFGLRVEDVDFLRRKVTVARQVVLVQGQPPMLAPPKTNASYRAVPVPAFVLDELNRHLATFGAGSETMFAAPAGGLIARNRFNERVWAKARANAGLPAGTGFHALRHHYASMLIAGGASVKTVQAFLGHASAKETLDTYGHLWPDAEDDARRIVAQFLEPLAASARPLQNG